MRCEVDLSHFYHVSPALGTPDFEPALIAAIKSLGLRGLPLQQAVRQGSVALDDDVSVRLLAVRASGHAAAVSDSAASHSMVEYKIGVQYTSLIAGCSCADDPTPMSVLPEYAECVLSIDWATGDFTVQLTD